MGEAEPAAATATVDEAALVAGLKARRPEAFETLVRTYTPRLLAVAMRMLGSTEDAQDVVQDAMLSAYRSIDRFEGNARVSTWLHRIVVNAALMKLRTRRRKREEYAVAFREKNPDKQFRLNKEQSAECKWSPEGLRVKLRLETISVDCDLHEALALSNFRDGERLVIYPR